MNKSQRAQIKINNVEYDEKVMEQFSNPLSAQKDVSKTALTNYTQSISRPKYDNDIMELTVAVHLIDTIVPYRLQEYNFNIEEINGERFYKPDGGLLLVREYDVDVVRDYYYNPEYKDKTISVRQILEHNKETGRLKTKIEPAYKAGSNITTNVAMFDQKVRNKYTILQLGDSGFVINISEFLGKGQSFQTLFRNSETLKPARYISGKEHDNKDFEMVDCIFNANGEIVRIKRYNNNKEIKIDYTSDKKNISVRTKNSDV